MCGKNPHIDSYMYRKLSHGERAKINGGPHSPLGYMRQCAFMIKFHNLQNYFFILFFIIIHVLSAHYQYAKFHIESLINKKLSLQVIRICKLYLDNVMY